MIGTRYVFLAIRTFMDPNDEADVQAAHKLQDQVIVKQADVGNFAVPNWDKEGIETLRTAINVLGATIPDSSTFFGVKDTLDPIHHMMGAAVGWGGLPREAALYNNVYPPKNDGKTAYTPDVERRTGRCLLVSDALRRRGMDADQSNSMPTRSTA